jgi:UDP-N-acetylglucosamine--N-acetylmuramyl-(pentapeptide) pyrophosphoryl-undecaprenol N-acetylglucosamine transferase
MTCAELTAVGLPAAYVPLPHGNGEQRKNAVPIEQVGGGIIVDDAQLSPAWITETLLPVLLDPELVAAMSRAAAGAGRRDADRWLAAEVLNVMRGGGRREGRRPRHGGGGRGSEAGWGSEAGRASEADWG